ncbi:MAG TPA: Holliday junction branch migration protein RuvA [Acidimicrobiaceae bacterium]|jgi:Holliday junction DNA helicase RuvA|nr:Holliday junction branch migration protein RuvA [Acidimicrobiaceae bacterium]
MIGSLRGSLLDRVAAEVTIEVAGLGYRLVVTPFTAASLGPIGAECFVWVHHHIREDAQTLYGFSNREERDTFELLIGTHGVGPSLGMAILGTHDPSRLRLAVAADDLAALCLVPGVGKKTAQRLLVELKSRLDTSAVDLGDVVSVGDGSALGGGALADVREALVSLGYTTDEVAVALKGCDPAEEDSSVLLRVALQRLAGR